MQLCSSSHTHLYLAWRLLLALPGAEFPPSTPDPKQLPGNLPLLLLLACAMSNPAASPEQMQALESRVQELELGSARVTGERDSLRERLRALESSRQQLAEEFIILKSNYLALGRELEQEVMRNEELTQELLSLAKESIPPPGPAHQSSPELGTGRAAARPRSARRGKQPEDAAASGQEQQELEGSLLGNQDHIKVELEKLKKSHDEQQQKLEERVLALGQELQEAKGAVGAGRRRLVEQSAVLLTSQGQLQEVEAENSRLQLRLKELNEEYRSRLAQYTRDVAVGAPSPGGATEHGMSSAGRDHRDPGSGSWPCTDTPAIPPCDPWSSPASGLCPFPGEPGQCQHPLEKEPFQPDPPLARLQLFPQVSPYWHPPFVGCCQ
uniref:Coiled-coil domain containing 78 n=1 Tax=Ficedula albicollis TaxID=59894 RepID=A0A803VZH3_FICAL